MTPVFVVRSKIASERNPAVEPPWPIATSAVYVAPPFNHRKDRFKSVSTQVFRQPETFDTAVLADFIAAIRQAKAADGASP